MPVTQEGTVWAFNNMPGLTTQDLLTNDASSYILSSGATSTTNSQTGSTAPSNPKANNYLLYLGGFVAIIVALKYVQEWDKSGIKGEHVGINVHNVISTGIQASLFIIVFKVLINKYLSNVKPVADLVNIL